MNHHRILLTSLLGLLLFSCASWAQITITRNNFETLFAANQQIYFYTDTSDTVFQVDIGQTGGSHVYDFSGFQLSRIDTGSTMSITQVPQFTARFPGDALALKSKENPGTNDDDYYDIYRSLNNGLFIVGEANISSQYERYLHIVPEELFLPYPMTFGYSTSFSAMFYDTTFVGGVATQIDSWNSTLTKDADGWGTLTLPGFGSFNCLRWREVVPGALNSKVFYYLTQEGYLLIVGSTDNQPDTGVITAQEISLFVAGSLVGVGKPSMAPQAFTLAQNYPNPFNPQTTIGFTLPKDGRVTMDIFDISGRRIVRAYRNTPLPAGGHTYTWDGTNDSGRPVASGVYLYRLQAGSGQFVQARKMMLLK